MAPPVLLVTLNFENLLLLGSVLIIFAVLANKLGSRFGLPLLLISLIIGMLAGPDVLGLHFDDYETARSIGHFATAIVLFEAGLETSFRATRPVLWQGITLSTVGVLFTVAILGFFVYLAYPAAGAGTFLGCLLVAVILSPTDSVSVFSMLKNKRLQLRENLGEMLELESGGNDPVAGILTAVMVVVVSNSQLFADSGLNTGLTVSFVLFRQLFFGAGVGFIVGYLAVYVLKHLQLNSGSLTAILVLSFGLLASGLAEYLKGSGLLAIYIAAIIMGQMKKMPYKKEVDVFFEGATWLAQLVMFLMLGLLARPSLMGPMILPSIFIGLFLIFVARPLSVLITLLPFRRPSFKARLFTSWVGIKGSAPILFATFPVIAAIPESSNVFNSVLIVTIMSLLIQGRTLAPMARWLGLSIQEDEKPETFGMDIPEEIGELRDHIVTQEDLMNGATLRELHLPHGIRVMMVRRDGRFLVPHGSMELHEGDHLVIILGETDDD